MESKNRIYENFLKQKACTTFEFIKTNVITNK